jgi:hypothetical protein
MNTKRNYTPRDKKHVDFATYITEKQMLSWVRNGTLQQTELGLERRCPICHDYWPYDNGFFYDYKSACIACFQERRERYRETENKTDIQ